MSNPLAGTNPITLRCGCGCAWRMFPSAIDACPDGVHCPACREPIGEREPAAASAEIAAFLAGYVARQPDLAAMAAARDRAARMRTEELSRMRGGR